LKHCNYTFSALETPELKALLSPQKCAQCYVRQFGIFRNTKNQLRKGIGKEVEGKYGMEGDGEIGREPLPNQICRRRQVLRNVPSTTG